MALTKEKLKDLFAAGEFDQYLPDSEHEHSYLPLSGGTMTGSIWHNVRVSDAIGHGFRSAETQEQVGYFGAKGDVNGNLRYLVMGQNSTNDTGLKWYPDGTATLNNQAVITSGNYTDYVPSKTGDGASGKWGITAEKIYAYEGRVASLNISPVADSTQKVIILHGGIAENPVPGKFGFVQHFEWDNLNGSPAQVFISNEVHPQIFARSRRGGNWNAWVGFQKKITYGTAAPSGGVDGDIYIQYW